MTMNLDEFHKAEEEPEGRPSKTQRKRESAALQDLGGALVRLSREQLTRLDLPEDLYQAVVLGQSLKHDGSLKRQRKYIGKLLRKMAPEPIQAKLAEITRASAAATRSLHRIEGWRDRLLAEGDAAIHDLMAHYPHAERPKLRQLVETARLERDRGQLPKAARLLFRHLRELMEIE